MTTAHTPLTQDSHIAVWSSNDGTILHHHAGLTLALTDDEELALLEWLKVDVARKKDIQGLTEFPAKRDNDKSEWVNVRFVLNSLMNPMQALDQLKRMLDREYEGWEFIEMTILDSDSSATVSIKPRNDYEWSVSDRDRFESITSFREVGLALKSWEVIEPHAIDSLLSRSYHG